MLIVVKLMDLAMMTTLTEKQNTSKESNPTYEYQSGYQYNYSADEHRRWQSLYTMQVQALLRLADTWCIKSIHKARLPIEMIPNLLEFSNELHRRTGWRICLVDDIVSGRKFFSLLANKHFPCSTYIRSESEYGLSPGPDIFHEIFGHCTLLHNTTYGNFIHQFSKIAMCYSGLAISLLLRLFWFTIEVGLIKQQDRLRIYGSSLLSSIDEATYSIESNCIERREFNIIDILRTPYRADIKQPIYYVIDDYTKIYSLIDVISRPKHFQHLIDKAATLGEYKPTFDQSGDSHYMSIGILCKYDGSILQPNADVFNESNSRNPR